MWNIKLRPLSMTTKELAEKLAKDAKDETKSSQDEDDEEYQEQRKQVLEGLERVEDLAKELELDLMKKDETLGQVVEPEGDEFVSMFEPQATDEQAKEDEPVDVYEQMRQQIEELEKSLELQQEESAEDGEKSDKDSGIEEKSQKEQLMERSLAAVKAKALLGEHKTFASFSKDRFNYYLKAGEDHLKEGKYCRAADAYTMALFYEPGNPLPYAGKSHALFAAGEYMSSALFLSRAIEIFPEYAMFKIDIVAMVGDRDKLESRIVDVKEWMEKSGSGELEFLLAYIYHQMEKPQWAKEAIATAYKKMPESVAVIALKEAIEAK